MIKNATCAEPEYIALKCFAHARASTSLNTGSDGIKRTQRPNQEGSVSRARRSIYHPSDIDSKLKDLGPIRILTRSDTQSEKDKVGCHQEALGIYFDHLCSTLEGSISSKTEDHT